MILSIRKCDHICVLITTKWLHCFINLYCRHHSLSQWVQACVVCSNDVEHRAKVIAKFIELARALQSSCFGNVFAFFAVMSGLATSQVRIADQMSAVTLYVLSLGVWSESNLARISLQLPRTVRHFQ